MPDTFEDYREEKKTKRAEVKRPKRRKPLLLTVMASVGAIWGILVLGGGVWVALIALSIHREGGPLWLTIYCGIRGAVGLLFGLCIAFGGFLMWRRSVLGMYLILGPSWLILLESLWQFSFFMGFFARVPNVPGSIVTINITFFVIVFAITALFTVCHHNDEVRRNLRE